MTGKHDLREWARAVFGAEPPALTSAEPREHRPMDCGCDPLIGRCAWHAAFESAPETMCCCGREASAHRDVYPFSHVRTRVLPECANFHIQRTWTSARVTNYCCERWRDSQDSADDLK